MLDFLFGWLMDSVPLKALFALALIFLLIAGIAIAAGA